MATAEVTGATVVALADHRPQPLDRRGWRLPEHMRPGAPKARPPANKGVRYPKHAPSALEVQQLLDAIDVGTFRGRRLRAAAAVMYRSGVRVKELVELEERDVHRQDGLLHVRFGKSRVPKPRYVGLDAWGWRELDAWLEAREELPPGPLFCVVKGPTTGTRAWQTDGVRQDFRAASAAAGLRNRVHPHALRHAYAVSLYTDPAYGLLEIQRTLGHADLRTTEIYLSSFDDRLAAMNVARRGAPMVPIRHAA